jgi:hypothetical protein
MKAEKARLDADRTAQPKSKIVFTEDWHGKLMPSTFKGWGVPRAYVNETQTILLAPEDKDNANNQHS